MNFTTWQLIKLLCDGKWKSEKQYTSEIIKHEAGFWYYPVPSLVVLMFGKLLDKDFKEQELGFFKWIIILPVSLFTNRQARKRASMDLLNETHS
jgi:hypothetical protein